MLYHLLYPLHQHFSVFNVFKYLTFRSFIAFLLALVLTLTFQPAFISWFKRRQLSQPIRDDGPQSHLSKKGTPTMGGVVIVAAVIFSTFCFADLLNPYIWIVLGVTCSYGLLGFIDDFQKVRDRSSKGVSARSKLFWQFSIACAFVIILVNVPGFNTTLTIPFLKHASFELGWLFVPIAMLVIVGCSNAVNLTDGLDGLVIGPIITVASAYGAFSYVAGNAKIAEYLQVPYVAGAGDLTIFAAAIVAGGLGFLWYNSFPASVFMGDVGALALGGALGTMAVVTKQEILLILTGGIFVIEALSVIIQVFSFKYLGKRILKMAPLHHHFELNGLSEPKIIVRMWIVSLVLALLSIATLKLR